MGGHHHSIDGVSSRMLPAQTLDAQAPAPFYIASNCRLARNVAAGELIRMGDLVLDEAGELLRLRREQDQRHAGEKLSA